MSTPTPAPNPPAAPRAAQVALGLFLAVLVGLLAVRGYGNRLSARPTDRVTVADLTDLNTADASELAQVPGVGPKLAQAIADHRRAYGPFRSVEELHDVRGVGPLTFDKLRAQFRVNHVGAPERADPPPAPASAAPAARPPGGGGGGGARKLQPGDPPINVNTATADDLMRLPGVGPITAQAIVGARATAPFRTVDDLDRVRGIGPKTLERLRPFVTVE